MATSTSNFVLSEDQLEKIAREACEKSLSSANTYEHGQVAQWNGNIIKAFLASLTSAISKPNAYKFNVTSTILQHDSSAPNADNAPFPQNAGRGMHSASGAFWDAKTDGMWSFKYEGQGQRGFDVVVSVLWIGTGKE